jgi:glyceraldehyde-3-phosphate dehydrogenase (NAD(P)+) (phosphorylating)
MINVAVNGYGVIGRRLADIVAIQPDMKLIGITKVHPDYKAHSAIQKGYRVFGIDEKSRKALSDAGIATQGTVKDLVSQVDVVIDSSPEEMGSQNISLYRELGKKAVFQGGEEHELTGLSFVAQCNYEKAVGNQFTRVVSCNTTGLCRVLHSLNEAFGISKANVVIARRGTDPDDSSKGPLDSVVLDPATIPSHHGPDVNSVLPDFPVVSMAYKIPTTHMHLHSLIVSVKGSATQDSVIEKLENANRVMLVNGKKDGFKSTSNVIDMAREMGRPRNDIYESVVWRDSIKVVGSEIYFFMAIHQEAIVTPENVDAIRALYGKTGKSESIAMTNKSLGIRT